MSGDGVTSFRGSQSLLLRLRVPASQQGISIHEVVRRLVSVWRAFPADQMDRRI